MEPHKDRALIFFGMAALACLLVSLPATLRAMQLFHGNEAGYLATVVFEIGAVGAELATLAIPQWRGRLLLLTVVLLILTTGGNYALGIDHFGAAELERGTTYATIRAAGYGGLLAVMSSAIFPALLLVFLTATTARWRMVQCSATLAQQAETALEQLRNSRDTLLNEYQEFKEWTRNSLHQRDTELEELRTRPQLTSNADALIVGGHPVGCNALARELKINPSAMSRAVKRLQQTATEEEPA